MAVMSPAEIASSLSESMRFAILLGTDKHRAWVALGTTGALETRGLVTFEYRKVADYRPSHVRLTDLGRAVARELESDA